MMNEAIKKLTENGYSETEAKQEFNDKVNYYMRGTTHTAEDRAYAVKCAIEDIMDDEEEELTDEYLDMLDIVYA